MSSISGSLTWLVCGEYNGDNLKISPGVVHNRHTEEYTHLVRECGSWSAYHGYRVMSSQAYSCLLIKDTSTTSISNAGTCTEGFDCA